MRIKKTGIPKFKTGGLVGKCRNTRKSDHLPLFQPLFKFLEGVACAYSSDFMRNGCTQTLRLNFTMKS